MLCSMGVLSCTSSVSTVPPLTWMKMHMRQRNIPYMYVTLVGKNGRIVGSRFRVIRWHLSSCSWSAVGFCLASDSLPRCHLLQHHTLVAASKHRLLNRPLPHHRTQEMFRILRNQRRFLPLHILSIPPLGAAWVVLELLACHGMGVWLPLLSALCGSTVVQRGLTRWQSSLAG